MNRIYRLVWNKSLCVLQVASELATSDQGGTVQEPSMLVIRLRALVTACILALGLSATGVHAQTTVAANSTYTNPSGTTLGGSTSPVVTLDSGATLSNAGNIDTSAAGSVVTGATSGTTITILNTGSIFTTGQSGTTAINANQTALMLTNSNLIEGGLANASGVSGGAAIANVGSGSVINNQAAGLIWGGQLNFGTASAGVGISGSGFTLTNAGTIEGGLNNASGTGGAGVNAANSSISNSGTIEGGANGYSGNAGAGVSATTTIINNTGTIEGGANQDAQNTTVFAGTGITGSGLSITNSGTIEGGSNSYSSTYSNAGVGIVATGSSSITTSGEIAGGTSVSNSPQADAIDFSGGGNTLTLESGYSLVGNVVSTSGSSNGGDTLEYSAGTGTFNAAQLVSTSPASWTGTPQFYGFNTLLVNTSGTLDLSGESFWNGTINIASGTLAFDTTTQITGATIVDNATLDLSNTGGTNVEITSLSGTGNLLLGDSNLLLANANGTFSGVISGSGGLLMDGGNLTLTNGANSFADGVSIFGGTLTLSGNGSIGGGSIFDDGTFDISGETSTPVVSVISGGGNVTLGANSLELTAGGNFSGVISGTGGLTLDSGASLVLTGANTYTGNTYVASGASLQIGNGGTNGAIAGNIDTDGQTAIWLSSNGTYSNTLSGSGDFYIEGTGSFTLNANDNGFTGLAALYSGTLALGSAGQLSQAYEIYLFNGSTFDVSQAVNPTVQALVDNGIVNLGSNTLTINNADTNNAGTIAGTGGVTLNGTNVTETWEAPMTFTGLTTINNGVSLVLADNAAIAGNIQNNGALMFNTSSPYTYNGTIAGAGNLEVEGGQLTLTAANTYTGSTTVDAGASLILSGNAASIADSSGLIDNGTLDMSASETVNANNLTGNGNIVTGTNYLNIVGGGTGVFGGSISGTGGFSLTNGSSETFTGTNTFTLTASIGTGSTLTLEGAGSIAAADVEDDGTFDISNTSAGASVTGISGSGNVALGNQTLTLTNAGDRFDGVASGVGGVVIAGGTQRFSGANAYTGQTTINSGATLGLILGGSIADSTGIVDNGTFNIAGVSAGATVQTISGAGSVSLGNETLTVANANSEFDGEISGDGGLTIQSGVETLTGANTYTGSTAIDAGSTLALSGTGAVGSSSSVNDSGTFDISNTSNGAVINSLSGRGNVTLGSQNLTLSNASGTFSGSVSGTGGFNLEAGSETLSGVNTYTGTTVISGGTLFLTGANNISQSSVSMSAGTLDITESSGATIVSLSGGGGVNLGANNLTLSDADGTFVGIINGTGGLDIQSGTEILQGAQTYTGLTTINSGAELQVGIPGRPGSIVSNVLDDGELSFVERTASTYAGIISGNGTLVTQGLYPLTLSGINTLTGATTINNGTLALSGSGSIADSSSVTDNGTLDISATTLGASLQSLVGTGAVTLGSQTLTLVNANNSFSGVISGTGGLVLEAGNESLTGDNTYTGATAVNGGTLALTGTGSISDSHGVEAYGTLDISGTTAGASIESLSGSGAVTLGNQNLTITSGRDEFTGVIGGTGGLILSGGIEALGGANSYSGQTSINNGTLYLAGSGSIANSNVVIASTGSLDLSLSTGGATVLTLSGTGGVNLASQTLSLSNANSEYDGVLSGTGGLGLNAGSETFSAVNTYTGATTIANGATLYLIGSSSLASSTVAANGALDISGSAGGATIGMLSGGGIVQLGTETLSTAKISSNTFTGVIEGSGGLNVGAGTLGLTGINTYTGATTIANNADLTLSGNGSISESSGVIVNGTFNISSTFGGASVTTLSGDANATVLLGGQSLNLTNADGTYAGYIGGSGGLSIFSGTETLSGTNGYAGNTNIDSGATLALVGGGSIGNSAVGDNGTLDISGSTGGAAVESLTGIGNVTLGNQTLSITDGNSTLGGVISGTGGLAITGGNQSLSGNNTYTGATSISNGATLALFNNGSIDSSSSVADNGTFDISNANADTAVSSLSGSGSVVLGTANLTLTSAVDTFAGNIGGTGGLNIEAGTETLTGTNTYTGGTTIVSGATLALAGNGSVGGSAVADNGTLDLSGSTGGAALESLQGTGNVTLGNASLAIADGAGTFYGVISGTGGIALNGGSQALAGVNTYAGETNIAAGSSLSLLGTGSIATSSTVDVEGALDISQTTNGASITSLKGSGTVDLGNEGLTITNGADTFGGSIAGVSSLTIAGGTQTLSGNNTYSGGTTINAGATLDVAGTGTLGTGALVVGGTLDISGTTDGLRLNSLSGSGQLQLGNENLTLTNADGTFSGLIAGTGALVLDGGVETLTGTAVSLTGGVQLNGGTLLINPTSVDSTIAGAAGSNGGAGGDALVMSSGSGLTSGANSQIIGGAGGDGTTSGGAAGRGISGSGFTFVNDSSALVQGGNGGSASGTPGAGGVGLVSTGDATIVNAGVISGGVAGDGTTQADAVDLSGGGNSLTLINGYSFVGNVVSTSGTTNGGDTLALSGSTDSSLNVSSIVSAQPTNNTGTTQFYGFANYVKNDSSTWTLTGTATVPQDWQIDAGNLQGDANSLSGNLSVASGANVTFDQGTANDNSPSAAVFDGTISGAGSLTKVDDGTLILDQASTYTGGTLINDGTIGVGNSSALGTGVVNMSQGTGLSFQSTDLTLGNAISISGETTLSIQEGAADTISGVISGETQSGEFLVSGGGTLNLSAANTYSGTTEIGPGSTLSLGATGSITNSSVDVGNGANFNISATSGTSVQNLSGVGNVTLGDASLTLTNGSGVFSGSINGQGALILSGNSNETLGGVNTYTGGTTIGSAASLTLETGSAIAGNVVDSGKLYFNRSDTYDFGGSISGAGTVQTGGAGTVVFTSADTYSGGTTISSGSTLELSGAGSIASSSSVDAEGTFDISRVASGSFITNLTGSGSVNLGGQNLTITNASATFSGEIEGTGGLTLSGGTLILSGDNTFSGAATISAGTTLNISGAGTLGSGAVVDNGSLDISGASQGLTQSSLSGSGLLLLGNRSLTLTNATGTFSGLITGTGFLVLDGGTETLTGSAVDLQGGVQLNGGTLMIDPTGTSSDIGGATGSSGAAGGDALVMNSGSGLTNASGGLIQGGTGGSGTSAGGAGGRGVFGSDFTFINAASSMVHGGAGGTGTETTGTGGVGVVSTGGSSIINAGAISGGIAGDGITQADAVDLSGGNNTLTLLAGFGFTGNVVSTSGVANGGDTLSLGGATSSAFNVSSLVDVLPEAYTGATDYYGFANYVKDGSGSWTLTGTATFSQNWQVNAGTLQGDASSLFGSLTVASGANVTLDQGTANANSPTSASFNGTISGNGTLTKVDDGTLILDQASTYTGGTVLNAGTLDIGSDAALGTGAVNMAKGTTLGFESTGMTLGNAITIAGDPTFTVQVGATDTISGVISDGTTPGDIIVTGGGTLNLSAANTFTGTTTVNAGSTLALSGSGAIASSNDVTDSGTLDISATPVGATINSLTGDGHVALGARTLMLTNAHDTFGGALAGAGNLVVETGTETLTGNSTTTGTISSENGATIALAGNGSIAAASDVIDNGGLDLSGANGTVFLTSLDGTGSVKLGANSLSLTQADGTFSGSMQGTGGLQITAGTETLTGASTQTGNTIIAGNGVLYLAAQGSLASTRMVDNGALDISATASGASFTSLAGNGLVTLGSQALSLSNASDTFGGVIAGQGALIVAGGSEALSAAQAYRGITNINSGAKLSLTGAGGIASSGDVIVNGGLDVSGATSASVVSLDGNATGYVTLGSQQLNLTNANGAFGGTVSGMGGLRLSAGYETLLGANTYTGVTTIDAGASLSLSGAGSLADSSDAVVNGTFDMSASAGPVALTSLDGAGAVHLGNQTLTLTNASGNFGGVIDGAGGLTLNGGTETLSGANTYTGITTINAGKLALAGTGSIASSSGVVDNGTLDIAGSVGTAITNLTGNGTVQLGNEVLTVTNGSSFSGTVQGVGSIVYANSPPPSGGGTPPPVTIGSNIQDNVNVTFASTSAITYSGTISGTGGLQQNGAGTTTLTSANTATGTAVVAAGLLEVGSESTPTATWGGDADVEGDGTLRGHGTVDGSVTNNANVRPGGSIGVLSIQGNYNQSSQALLQIDVSPTAASELVVAGAANLAGNLELIYAPGTYTATNFTILHAGSLSGSFASTQLSGSVPTNLNSAVVEQGSSLSLQLTAQSSPSPTPTPSPSPSPSSPTPTPTPTPPPASTPSPTPTPGSPTGGPSPVRVAPLDGSVYANVQHAQLMDAQRDLGTVLNTPLMLATTQCGSGGQHAVQSCGNGTWVQETASQTSITGPDGVHASGFGLLGGVDGEVANDVHIGGDAGLDQLNATDGVGSQGTVQSVHAGVYAFGNAGPVVVSATVDGAHNTDQFVRSTGVGHGVAHPDGNDWSGGAQAAWPVAVDDWTITPKVGALYAHQTLDHFAETDISANVLANAFAVNGQTSHYTSLQPFVSFGAVRPFQANGVTMVPMIELGYRYEVRGLPPSVALSAQDATVFAAPGSVTGRGQATVHVSMTAEEGESWSVHVDYTGLFGDRVRDNEVSFGFTKHF